MNGEGLNEDISSSEEQSKLKEDLSSSIEEEKENSKLFTQKQPKSILVNKTKLKVNNKVSYSREYLS